MANCGLLALALALTVAPAARAEPDWRAAGGALFVPTIEATETGEGDAQAPRLPEPVQPFGADIVRAAERHGLDPKLLHALVAVESAYRPQAVSHAGAAGLTQLMPATALDLGVTDRTDPTENLRGGADYLARQLVRFGDVRLALAAYNSGPERVARLGRIPAIAETQAYVASVLDCYLALAAGRPVRTARDCRTPARFP